MRPRYKDIISAGIAGAFLGGITCGGIGTYMGFRTGYNINEILFPQISISDYNGDGDDDLCVELSYHEIICALDLNQDGSMDFIVVDTEKDEITELKLGENPCPKKSDLEKLIEQLDQNK
ncbi:MAG: hypothetical protein AABX05_02300 [Nanoarchaeota archaeon]